MTCPQLEAALLGDRDVAEAHQKSCEICRAGLATMGAVRGAVKATERPLDDLARARIGLRLNAQLDLAELERTSHRPWRPGWRSVAAVAVLAGAAAVTLWLVRRPGAEPKPTARSTPAPAPSPAPAPAPAPVGTPDTSTALLMPYVLAGEPLAARAEGLLGHRVSELELPAGTLARLGLAGRARVTLVGPGRLSVESVTGDRIVLGLAAGTLLCDYDHAAGGSLVIDSPGASTTVVGTLFSIEAQKGTTRVSVARGRVAVDTGGGTVEVNAKRSVDAASRVQAAIADDVAGALAEHDAVLGPPSGEWGTLALSGVPVDAEARLGDRVLGHAPLWAAVPTGARAVQINAPGRPVVELTTSVRTGQSSTLIFQGGYAPSSGTAGRASRAGEPTPAPAPAPAPPRARTLEQTYAAAETAMRKGNQDAARAALRDVLARFPRDPLAGSALYELARMAFKSGDLDGAASYLDQLLARKDATLGEMAAYLRCRVDRTAGRSDDASRCLERFRTQYPESPHDADALALLVAAAGADCARARPLLAEYLQRYPEGPFAKEARQRRDRCAR